MTPNVELTGPLRRDGLARVGKMYRVPQAGPRRPAVEGPVVQRGVRPHLEFIAAAHSAQSHLADFTERQSRATATNAIRTSNITMTGIIKSLNGAG